MRCNNCGWENPDGSTKCEKCNAPLGGGEMNHATYGTARETGAPPAYSLNKTVNEAVAFEQPIPQGQNVCPQCGYPMRPGVSVCPNCQNDVTHHEAQPRQVPNVQKPIQNQGTVNPWIQVSSADKCILEPIPQIGIETPERLQLKGEVHDLNRDNLDPENQTITSKVQAQLTCENGQWFISDKSSQHTTFIYAGKKTSLQDGDVILMGNRQFIFHTDK